MLRWPAGNGIDANIELPLEDFDRFFKIGPCVEDFARFCTFENRAVARGFQ